MISPYRLTSISWHPDILDLFVIGKIIISDLAQAFPLHSCCTLPFIFHP